MNKNDNQKIIAVVGMCGAGKSEVINILKEKNFINVYFGEATFDELKKRNLPVTPENERLIREEFRASGDMSIYAKFAEPKIDKALESGKDVSLESLYAWSEYKYLKAKFGEKLKLLAVVTNSDLRTKRLATRQIRPLTPEQVITRDYSQIENLEQGGPIAKADYYIINNGSMEELKEQVINILKNL